MKAFSIVFALAAVTAVEARAADVPRSDGEPIPTGAFATVETGKNKPRGISGFACLPVEAGRRRCVAVNDEERFAQWATLTKDALTPDDARIQLLTISDQLKDMVVGRKPKTKCNGTESFGEFDGEAVAISQGELFVVGSHSCARSSEKFRSSSFILARTKASGRDVAAADIKRTWRVADVIAASDVGKSLGRPGPDGAGIEGMAVIGARLFLGLRTPVSKGGKATILVTDIGPLFAPGDAPASPKVETLRVKLGGGAGIRDLAALGDRTLLVLSGPAGAEDGTYAVHLLDLATRSARALAILTPQSTADKKTGQKVQAKPEALTVLEQDANSVSVLIMHDNVDDGGPRLHRIALTKQ